jgi:hypothetical protein
VSGGTEPGFRFQILAAGNFTVHRLLQIDATYPAAEGSIERERQEGKMKNQIPH